MRSTTSLAIVFIALCLTATAYAAATPSGESAILCLNGKVSTESVQVSMTPFYDWMHAGQQGINLTVSNKTDRNIVIDWEKTFYPGLATGESYRGESTPPIEPGIGNRQDVVGPRAEFSKTLWPRSSLSKAGRLENRKLYLTATTGKERTGGEVQEEILLDVSGENRICSR
jgi:hypothetical protein